MWPNQWIEQYLAIDSTTNRSNRDAIEFLLPIIKKCGLVAEVLEVRERGGIFFNFIARPTTLETSPRLVLHTHLDTVHGGDPKLWTKTGGDPLKATFDDEYVYGLGSADVKLDLLCKLWAAKSAVKGKIPFAVVGAYGEERGLVGAKRLLKSRKIAPQFAIVGEPSELAVVYAHKGHLVVSIELELDRIKNDSGSQKQWQGVSAHSSTPRLGKNALEKALQWFARNRKAILSLEGGTDSNRIPERCTAIAGGSAGPKTRNILTLVKKLQALHAKLVQDKDRRFAPSTTTLSFNLARVTRHGHLQLTFDMRLLPHSDIERIETSVRKVIAQHAELTTLCLDPPLSTDKNSELVKMVSKSVAACGITARAVTKASSTEAALYQAHGAEAVVFGPGASIGNVHRPNESCRLAHLEAATAIYTHLLNATWSGHR